jgi:peptide/nickel transport system permease protein
VLNYTPVRLLKAILLRLLFGAVSLLFISFVTFLADEIAPGDAATALAGEKATLAQVEQKRKELGLNRPWTVRYVEFVGKAATGDLGRSYFRTREPVRDILASKLPLTMKIASYAIVLASLVGVFLGTVAAVYQNRFADRTVLTVSTLGVTVPNFVLAPILVYFLAVKADLLPQTWDTRLVAAEIFYLILPVSILAARPAALLTRLTRASMIDTLQQEFIRTATAKGVPRGRLLIRHALRNAILPVITAIGTSFGFLLTGSFVIERAFTIPGIGSATIEAILQGDMPVVQAGILVTGTIFIVLNLLVDVLLPILDPRIRESQV